MAETQIPTAEKETILRARMDGFRVVSALRRYRAAAAKLLAARYRDGECDSVELFNFANECERIEEELRDA